MASKRTKTSVEKVLAAAIEAETVELRAELTKAQQRIAQLERTLAGVSATCLAAIGTPTTGISTSAPAPMPPQLAALLATPGPQEPDDEDLGPGPELAGEDNMGAGRWV